MKDYESRKSDPGTKHRQLFYIVTLYGTNANSDESYMHMGKGTSQGTKIGENIIVLSDSDYLELDYHMVGQHKCED